MDTTRDGAFVVFGGSIITAYGLVSLATSYYLNGMTTLGTGDYLRLWALTFLVIAFGFATVLGGFLLASRGEWKRWGGAALSVIGSLMGMILALGLITTVAGLSSSISPYQVTSSQSAQFSLTLQIQVIGSIIAVFLGFPLAMYGMMAGVMHWFHEPDESPEPEAAMEPSP